MTQLDTLQIGSAATSVTAAAASTVTPHPLQLLAWVVAIAAGIFSIYRGVMADRRALRGKGDNVE